MPFLRNLSATRAARDIDAARTTGKPRRKLRGVTLLEAILALGLGAVAITQGMSGYSSYNQNLKVEATASKIKILDRAAERFSQDNYDTLIAAAPAEYDIEVLEPYTGGGLGPDAFGNTYKLTTRTYTVEVADRATGGTKDQTVLQTLVVATLPDAEGLILDEDITLRSKIANTVGARGGFISKDEMRCKRPNGAQSRDGHICGTYGSYSIDEDEFSASDFGNATLVSLITTGDGATESDMLYRYSYGDEELNTMRTDLHMDGNKMTGVSTVEFQGSTPEISSDSGTLHVETDLNLRGNDIGQVDKMTSERMVTGDLAISGGTQRIHAPTGNLHIASGMNILAQSQNIAQLKLGQNGETFSNRLQLFQSDSRIPIINGSSGKLQIGMSHNYLMVGAEDNFVSPTGGVANMGDGGVGASMVQSRTVLANEIRSVFTNSGEELALQNVDNGTVTLGKKQASTVVGPDGTEFEISNGRLIVGEIQARNILCSECSSGDAFADHAWYNANSMGLHPYEGRSVYENFSGEPIQVSAWSKIKSSSGGWFMYVRQIGVKDADWKLVHSDTSEGGSGNTFIIPHYWEAMIVGAREVNLLLPKTARIKENHSQYYKPRWSILPEG